MQREPAKAFLTVIQGEVYSFIGRRSTQTDRAFIGGRTQSRQNVFVPIDVNRRDLSVVCCITISPSDRIKRDCGSLLEHASLAE